MIGVRGIIPNLNDVICVVDIAQAIEAGVKGADEVAFGIVDGGCQPALGVIAELVVHGEAARVAADRRDDIDQHKSEQDIEYGASC